MPESGKASAFPDAASGHATQESGPAEPLATDRDEHGAPMHRGWAPLSGRRRWVEPFVLALLARGCTYGYAVIGRLDDMRVSNGPVDAGLVYRTLQDLERAGQVRSSWSDEVTGPRRRAYEITDEGYRALDEWAAVMRERARLIGEFNADYLAIVSAPRPRAS
jgi:DNA-binding PadR family transcriptional regulator